MSKTIKQGDLILPVAQWDGARLLSDMVHKILPMLPPHVSGEQFAASVVAAANEIGPRPGKEAKWKPVRPDSVVVAAFNAARVGLIPGSALGLCYFIARGGVCNLEIGYQGYQDLAFGNDHLASLHAEVILREEVESERFKWWNDSEPHIEHHLSLDRDVVNDLQRRVVGAYCIYKTRAGGNGLRVLTKKQLDEVDGSGAKYDTPWKEHLYEMYRKTAIRRAAKDWKKTPQLSLAIRLTEQAIAGETQDAGTDLGFLVGTSEWEKDKAPFSLHNLPPAEDDQ